MTFGLLFREHYKCPSLIYALVTESTFYLKFLLCLTFGEKMKYFEAFTNNIDLFTCCVDF